MTGVVKATVKRVMVELIVDCLSGIALIVLLSWMTMTLQ